MIRLITATPGSGKTCMVIEWLLKELDKGFYKSIYANIEGLKIMGIKPLLSDWRDVPDEDKPCLYIVDEAQYHREFMKETTKDNHVGKDLSTHRHKAIDFWLITQSVKLLNSYVIENVGEHVHLYRPKKSKTVTVYWWSYAVTSMTKSNFKMADDVQKWRLNPQMFQYYKSTVAVTDGKARISQRNVSAWITFAIIMLVIAYFVNGGASAMQEMQHKETTEQKKEQTKESSPNPFSTNYDSKSVVPQDFNADQECRKAINVERPECIEWFNNLSKNGSSVTSTGQVVQTVSYNPSKPYEFEYQPQVQPTDFPRMSGVIKLSSGRLMAVDQQGNYMENISQDDCKKWLSGYRPFNYFAPRENLQSQRSVGEQPQVNPEISSL
jgi:hypothetical protein